MTNIRKFNVRKLFESFTGHLTELESLFTEFNVHVQGAFTPESAATAVQQAGTDVDLTALLYELNDLATQAGFEHVEDASDSFCVAAKVVEPGIPPAVAALRLRNADKDAFRNALDRLLVGSLVRKPVGVHYGMDARPITNVDASVGRFEHELRTILASVKDTPQFTIRHYVDGDLLIVLVFREQTASVQMQFESDGKTIRSSITRPVIEDMVAYDQKTGKLEIEAGRPKAREALRRAFAVGVMGDNSFFRTEQMEKINRLDTLLRNNFHLPVHSGHTVKITELQLVEKISMAPVKYLISRSGECIINTVRTFLRTSEGVEFSILKARIELTLGTGRSDRKVIELSGTNRIKYNRKTKADEVERYLSDWSLSRVVQLDKQSAA